MGYLILLVSVDCTRTITEKFSNGNAKASSQSYQAARVSMKKLVLGLGQSRLEKSLSIACWNPLLTYQSRTNQILKKTLRFSHEKGTLIIQFHLCLTSIDTYAGKNYSHAWKGLANNYRNNDK